ncbi:MAG: alpha/beta fold hydrolase [Rhodobacteraceae bacterium]|jgi:pimeloyl-ACP methyl ester carboxylesterase|nr:alpha/beta fold hydrolase [Paracoccaceae bacterium]
MSGPGPSGHKDDGGPGGPPLLLIHGLGGDRRMWDDCARRWRGRRRCIAVDLPGAGAVRPARLPPAPAELAARLAGLCDRLGTGRVVAVGCAVGSLVAAAFAAREPARTAALVLVNPILRITPEAGAVLRERAAAVRAGGMAAILPGAVERAFAGQPDDSRRRAFAAGFAAHDPEGYASLALGFLGADAGADCARISCPVLLVPGGEDAILPPWHAAGYLERLADARCVPVPEGAHFLPVQRPEALAAIVEAFLDAVPAAAGGRGGLSTDGGGP